jgi:quercetin dioxygenase-like cupin family protein
MSELTQTAPKIEFATAETERYAHDLTMVRHQKEAFRWEGVDVYPYKEDGGTHFKDITRQTLFNGTSQFPVELRYFEMDAGGHSTLERHEHVHIVTIIRGKGQVLVRDKVHDVGVNDMVHIPSLIWHQFRANQGEPLGFLCVVSSERDRPHRPTDKELEYLRSVPEVAEFIRV